MNADFTPWPPDVAAEYRRLGYWRGETFSAWLDRTSRLHAHRTALIHGDDTVTYADLHAQAERYATLFARSGLQAGDCVVVQLPNRAAFFPVCFGLMRVGAAPIMALPAHREREITFFCAHTDARAYVTVDEHGGFDHRRLARAAVAAAPSLRHVFILGDAAEFTPLRAPDEAGDLPPTPVDASTVALYQLSGGSTGTPKLIPRTHDDYLYSVRASADICALGPDTVYLAALPLAHNFPLSSPGTLGVLHAGGTVVIAPDPTPTTTFPLIERHGVTMAALVPALLLVWLQHARTHGTPGCLQLLQVGGAPLAADVARQVPDVLGCALQQVFGMAEGLVNYTRPGDPASLVYHTQGRPISLHDEVRIVNDDDEDVPAGVPGHLLTRGPYTIRGYFRADDHNRRAFTPEGYYRTGDVVTRRADGYLEVTGRHKDQINRAGEKVAAEEIEHVLLTHPAVHDVAVVGLPDAWLGERTCAFVQLTGAATPRLALDLKAHVRAAGLADYKTPDLIEFVDALPRTAFGKTNKVALRARLNERSPQ
ncbi:(2,3-dihydroxybenzoyl)adenylate synthase [Deinococcus maricopensis]|uniref:(2,3-dihydroxybenzoyl)adenylate synthase n=1 Tax=Deinococcus maricopensis (strain DSM 21211 / LMG 22137 / NRRL B-23946 / LB-34) TaxID=709986 RepID=E8U3H5_DEIML|nr:AMP-binding protein [Deinococcus maricopensis]ADV65846.1 (2,3-dihydroxybenzoyl)adenylate synthase [Deinococcus maricopensis DSM 21211]